MTTRIAPRTRLAGRAVVAMTVLLGVGMLTGCGGAGKTFTNARDLQKAFSAAGGSCPDSAADTGSGGLLAGASEVHCDGGSTELIVFPSNDKRDAFLSRIVRGDVQAVVGNQWAVLGKDVSQYAHALGGDVRTASH